MKQRIRYMIGFALVPILSFYLMEAFEHNALAEVRQEAQLFNILIFELIAWTLYLLIGRMTAALRIELIIALVFGITNHYVMAFRSTPFVPWDLLSVKTAASVAGNYDFTPTTRMIVVTVLLLLLMIAVRIFSQSATHQAADQAWIRGIMWFSVVSFCQYFATGDVPDETLSVSVFIYTGVHDEG